MAGNRSAAAPEDAGADGAADPEAAGADDAADPEAAGADDAAAEGAALAGADAAALEDGEDVEAVLLEPQAVSTSAAVATPAMSVKLRARSTCSPFLLCPSPVEDVHADSVNSDEPDTGRTLHRGWSSGDTRTSSVTELCSKWVADGKTYVYPP